MKELSIEEKAKAYDEAIERYKAKQEYESQRVHEFVEYLFPELKESEDERIRKAISQCVEDMRGQFEKLYKVHHKDAIAWLDKQCEQKHWVPVEPVSEDDKLYLMPDEQKPADKVEPKFHEGDWVVKGDIIAQILDVQEQYYVGLDTEGKDFTASRFLSNDKIHLWTIKDAKDGDILATLNHILIFEAIISKDGGVSYCHYDFGSSRPQFDFNKDDNWYFGKEAKVYPATKEQRDLLFQKMKEAGYEWDAEKKELKKVEQKPVWSEEDEQYLLVCKNALAKYQKTDKWDASIISQWLEFLKDRVCPKQEWSEEDENKLLLLEALCDDQLNSSTSYSTMYREMYELKDWLKSKKQWKPTEEQLVIIDMILTDEAMDDNVKSILKELKEQLKQL